MKPSTFLEVSVIKGCDPCVRLSPKLFKSISVMFVSLSVRGPPNPFGLDVVFAVGDDSSLVELALDCGRLPIFCLNKALRSTLHGVE